MRRCVLAVLFCALVSAGPSAAAPQGVQSKVEAAILFRDGLALVTRSADVPAGAGEALVRNLPPSTVVDYLEVRVLEGAVNVMGSSMVDDGQRKAVLLSLSGASACKVSVSYLVRDAGFEPKYRILAFPKYGKVYVETSAKMWQSTGEDWRAARVSLSSRSPVVQPAGASSAGPQGDIRGFLETSLSEQTAGSARGLSFAMDVPFEVSLPGDGSRRTYVVSGTEAPSEFFWIAYPGSGEVVVAARPRLPGSLSYLPGMASVSLDDALVGVLPFPGHAAGSKAVWQLGADPLVRVSRSSSGGTKGSGRVTQTTVVENRRPAAVSVRAEDEAPANASDVRPSGKASVSGGKIAWDEVVVEPGKSVSFTVSYAQSRPSSGKGQKKGGAK